MAISSLGPLAQPFGQAIGRNIGKVIGGAAGAAVIRCPSRSRRSSSAVRFSPDVQFSQQPLRSPHQTGEILGPVRPRSQGRHAEHREQVQAVTNDQIVSLISQSTAEPNALLQGTMKDMMQNMCQLMSTHQQEATQREDVRRREISTEVTGVTNQVRHLNSSFRVLGEQLSTNQGFNTEAFQQIRDEFR